MVMVGWRRMVYSRDNEGLVTTGHAPLSSHRVEIKIQGNCDLDWPGLLFGYPIGNQLTVKIFGQIHGQLDGFGDSLLADGFQYVAGGMVYRRSGAVSPGHTDQSRRLSACPGQFTCIGAPG